jgi:hypothetical protein
MPFRALDPESSVSTNSTTWAGEELRQPRGLSRPKFSRPAPPPFARRLAADGLVAAGIRVAGAALCLGALGCGTPPAARVQGATEQGVVIESTLIIGRDGGGSGLLWGLSVWLFGDTFSSVADANAQTLHGNSFAFSNSFDASSGIALTERTDVAGAPAYLLAPTDDEAAFTAAHQGDPCVEQPCGARYAAWPGSPLFDASRSRALIPYMLVWAAPGDFNFYSVGQSFAVWSDFTALPERPVVSPGAAHPTLLFSEDEPGFGTACTIDGDTLYAYACVQDGLSFPCLLAKVALESVLDRSAWLYWDGSDWSSALGTAEAVFDGAPSRTCNSTPTSASGRPSIPRHSPTTSCCARRQLKRGRGPMSSTSSRPTAKGRVARATTPRRTPNSPTRAGRCCTSATRDPTAMASSARSSRSSASPSRSPEVSPSAGLLQRPFPFRL